MIRSKNKLSSIIILLIAISYLYFAYQLPEYALVPMDSDIVPYVLGTILFILSIILFFEKEEIEEEQENEIKIDSKAIKMLAIITIYFILYAFTFDILGFIISSTLFIFISTITLGYKNHLTNLIVSIVIPFSFYYIFDLLQITLPRGILPF